MFREVEVRSKERVEFIDITGLIEKFVSESKVKSGICVIFVPHTTAGVTINENADRSVIGDIKYGLNKIVPEDWNYQHMEGNSPAHIKSTVVGNSLQLIIENNKLLLGTWQGVYFCEFDGPRSRKIYLKILS